VKIVIFIILNIILGDPDTQDEIDRMFLDYEKRAEIYLTRFNNTPIKPYMLSTAAKEAYLETGILVPVELALAQAQLESSLGTRGRSARNNPFNIGEYNSHTHLYPKNIDEGIKLYYYYLTNKYLSCKSVDDFLKDCTNCQGSRYATSPSYERAVRRQYNFIIRYIDDNWE
jgi:hypothetical protein